VVWRIFVIILIFSLISCAKDQARIKIYKYNHNRGLLVRKSGDMDVLTLDRAHGFLCISPRDLERLAEEIIARKNYGDNQEK